MGTIVLVIELKDQQNPGYGLEETVIHCLGRNVVYGTNPVAHFE